MPGPLAEGMQRRTVLGGLAGAATLAVGGWAARRGPTAGDSVGNAAGDEDGDGSGGVPAQIETIDAPGSEAGSLVLEEEYPLVVTFFATWCSSCSREMSDLTAAHAEVGDQVPFLSLTGEVVGRSVSRAEVADWWREHDGAWSLGLDPDSQVMNQFSVIGIPSVVLVDADGEVVWSDSGHVDTDALVAEAATVADNA